ncbi:von Willebrand factor A domain-containing protein 3A isoform X2 [Narcine bancroftii]|uniref:von Willebrand factor A domain-containing protein 3A isoform X2 n=1 Tax=Narcine bancroftii TaxID=1343680 RepID=UPI0038312B7E
MLRIFGVCKWCLVSRSRSINSPQWQQKRKVWQSTDTSGLEPDDGLLVTHINQTSKLLETAGTQTAEEWLARYSLQCQRLTLPDLLTQARILTNQAESELNVLQLNLDLVESFESRVRKMIGVYQERIQWLKAGSRKVFGQVKGVRLGVLIDCSDANCSLGRQRALQEALLALLDEQLCLTRQLLLLAFGSDVSPLWETARDINIHTLDEAHEWVQALPPSGSCNLLKALNRVLRVRHLDSLLIILGTCPDQPTEILWDYMQQCLLGRQLPIQAVAYDLSSHMTQELLRSLAETTGGSYHCYSSQTQACWGSDLDALAGEMQRAADVLERTAELRQGLVGDAVQNLLEKVSMEIAGMPPAQLLPRSPNHEGPLSIETPSFLPRTSEQWLKENGLRARRLGLYQFLAPNAFAPREGFVAVLNKTVTSTLHQRAMMQMEWHDRTVRNLHVDPPQLYKYQRCLARAVRRFEHRIQWLSTRGRRIWGTLCEKRVMVVLDLSLDNSRNLVRLQHALRMLLEQQLADKESFNVLAFGSEVRRYQPTLVPVTPSNLQAAWRWCLAQRCEGSRNLLAVLRVVLEMGAITLRGSCGLYLLTTGMSDQTTDSVTSYVAEMCGGSDLHLHVCLLTTDCGLDRNPVPRYASPRETADAMRELARAARGRFHWFQDSDIIESDDIQLLLAEVEKAANYSKKCAALLDSLHRRSGALSPEHLLAADSVPALLTQEMSRPPRLLPPKPTALTAARMRAREDGGEEWGPALKALTRHPCIGSPAPPPAHPATARTHPSTGRRRKRQLVRPAFYTDEGIKVGAVYQTQLWARRRRTEIPTVSLPKEEQICSTAEWLRKLSVTKLGLNLHRLVRGRHCSQRRWSGRNRCPAVAAKYCSHFPTVQIKGELRHLYLQPDELDHYIGQLEQVKRRYLGRLQWLLSGSRRWFGTILEQRVCILLDTSGSTEPFLDLVKKELNTLIWDQLRGKGCSFNLLLFAEGVLCWKSGLVEATDTTCQHAIHWVSGAVAHGGTCTLEALQEAFRHAEVQGIYLLTDGKPDSSCRLVLSETQRMGQARGVKVHTVSFTGPHSSANEFLKKLAAQTGGRFHRCLGDLDGQKEVQKMLTGGCSDEDFPKLPDFEGDDLKKLSEEINKARQFLAEAKSFRVLLSEKQMSSKSL